MISEMFINLPITSGVGNSGSAELSCSSGSHPFTNLPRQVRSTHSHSGGLPIGAILLILVVLAGSLGVTITVSVQSTLKSPFFYSEHVVQDGGHVAFRALFGNHTLTWPLYLLSEEWALFIIEGYV